MGFVRAFELMPVLDSLTSLVVAFVLGTLIGVDRRFKQRSAGLRTNTLVALGAAAFVDLGHRLGGDAEAARGVSNGVTDASWERSALE